MSIVLEQTWRHKDKPRWVISSLLWEHCIAEEADHYLLFPVMTEDLNMAGIRTRVWMGEERPCQYGVFSQAYVLNEGVPVSLTWHLPTVKILGFYKRVTFSSYIWKDYTYRQGGECGKIYPDISQLPRDGFQWRVLTSAPSSNNTIPKSFSLVSWAQYCVLLLDIWHVKCPICLLTFVQVQWVHYVGFPRDPRQVCPIDCMWLH